jgi:hypothetical protein
MSVTFDPALACKSTFINASSPNSGCCTVSVCVALPCASYFFEQYTSPSETRMPVTGVKVGDLPSRRRVDLRVRRRVLKVAPPPPTRGATSETTLRPVIHCLEPLSRADTHQHASSDTISVLALQSFRFLNVILPSIFAHIMRTFACDLHG